jgi:outer membrane protein, heavy metal efflux system
MGTPIDPHQSARQTIWQTSILCALIVVGAAGCRTSRKVQTPEFAAIASRPIVTPVSYEAVVQAVDPQVPQLAGPHPVQDYVSYALFQNPQIQAKRNRVEAAAQRVPQAASLRDPMVTATGYPFFPYTLQTAAGAVTANVGASQEVPWFGKLRTKANAAEAEVNLARAELAAAELEVIEQVRRAYYELYFVQKSLVITEQSRRLAVDLARIAEAKFRAAQVSQQDYLRAELAVQSVDADLIRLRQDLQTAQARVAKLLHISPDTPVAALADLPAEQLPDDLQRLYRRAIAARPELHAQLAAIERDRQTWELAKLQYFPDVTVSAAWGGTTTTQALAPTANSRDIVQIGLMANIPIYRKRLQAGVREAESKTVASAREYDSLRDKTQQDVKDLFVEVNAEKDLLRLFDSQIVPTAEQTLRVSIPAYESGQTDILQLLDNWRDLLRYQIMQQRLEAQIRQSLASLDRVIGGFTVINDQPQRLPEAVPSPAPAVVPPIP